MKEVDPLNSYGKSKGRKVFGFVSIVFFLTTTIACVTDEEGRPGKSIERDIPFLPRTEVAFRDFVAFDSFIALEEEGEIYLREITALEVFEDVIFVLDRAGRQVLRFDHQGKLIGRVGGEGEGPGEYEMVYSITKVGVDHLWISTPGRALFFHKDGQHLWTKSYADLTLPNANTVKWFSPDNLVLMDVFGQGDHRHFLYEFGPNMEKPISRFGFGTYLPFEKDPDSISLANNALIMYGSDIWTAPASASRLTIHQNQGRDAEIFPQYHPDGLEEDDLPTKRLEAKGFRKIMRQHRANFAMHLVDGYVFVILAGGVPPFIYDVYTSDGNIHTPRIAGDLSPPLILGTYDGKVYAGIITENTAHLTEEEQEALAAFGSTGPDQRFLWVGKLHPKLPPPKAKR